MSIPPSNATHLYILTGKEQTGPFTSEQIRAMWNAGAITADAFYWGEGLSAWQPVADLMAPQADSRKHNNATVSEPRNIYINEGGQESGPHTLKEVVNKYRRKQISDQGLYWTSENQDWRNILQHEAVARVALTQRSKKEVAIPRTQPANAGVAAKNTELTPASLLVAGACVLGCIICFAALLGGAGEEYSGVLAMGAILLFTLAILIPCLAMIFDDPANAFHAPRIDPKTITAAASVYTAYQVRQIRKELRDTSDFDGS